MFRGQSSRIRDAQGLTLRPRSEYKSWHSIEVFEEGTDNFKRDARFQEVDPMRRCRPEGFSDGTSAVLTANVNEAKIGKAFWVGIKKKMQNCQSDSERVGAFCLKGCDKNLPYPSPPLPWMDSFPLRQVMFSPSLTNCAFPPCHRDGYLLLFSLLTWTDFSLLKQWAFQQ